MIQISTPVKNSLCADSAYPENCREAEGLSEEDERFFSSLTDGLNKISKMPRNSTLTEILTYSKSF